MLLLTWSLIWFFIIWGITITIPAVAAIGSPLYFVSDLFVKIEVLLVVLLLSFGY